MSKQLTRRPAGRRGITFVAAASALAITAAATQAVTFTKADNNSQLNQTASYVGPPAALPTAADVVLFDATLATPANGTVGVGGNLVIGGLQVTNPSGPISIENGLVGGQPVASVFTVGLSGTNTVDLSTATQDLTINTTTLRLGPGSAVTNTFVVQAGRTFTTGAGTTMTVQGGTHTLNLTGAGNYVFNGAITSAGGALIGTFGATGTTTLAGANNFSTSLALNAGTYNANNDAALTTGRLDLGSAATPTIQSTNGDHSYGTSPVRFTGSAIFAGSNSLAFGGAVTANRNGARTATNNLAAGKTLTFSGVVSLTDTAAAPRTFTVAGTGDTILSNAIGELAGAAGSLAKTGAGTLTLSGANTYTGTTGVTGGTLFENGTHAGAGDYTVAAAGTLAGTGTITTAAATNNVTVNGTLAPGSVATPIETLDVATGNLALAGTANFQIDQTANANDKSTVGNALTYGGVLNVLVGNSTGAAGTFDLFDFATQSGAFATINFTGLASGQTATFDPTSGVVTLAAAAVPEPATLAALGLLGTLALKRRRTA